MRTGIKWPQWRMRHEQRKQAVRDARKDERVEILAASVDSIARQLDRDRKQRDMSGAVKESGDRRTFWALIVTMVATAAAAIATACQAYLSRIAIDDGRTATVEANRAYISPIEAVFDEDVTRSGNWNVTVHWKNVGRQPASEVVTLMVPSVSIIHPSDVEPRQIGLAANNSCQNEPPKRDSRVAYPDHVYNWAIQVPRTPEESAALIDGKQTLVVNGCITYRTFDAPHRSAFCFYAVPPDWRDHTWHWAICPEGNEAT